MKLTITYDHPDMKDMSARVDSGLMQQILLLLMNAGVTSSQLTQRAADWGKRLPHLGHPCICCGADGRLDGFCPNR